MLIQNNSGQNFTAIHKFNIKNTTNLDKKINFKVFEITPSDKSFLNSMYENIDLEKLTKGITQDKIEVWYTMIKEAIRLAQNSKNKSYLLAQKQKPCGIMTFTPEGKKYEILRVATWPIKKDEKTPLAGTALFKTTFEDFAAQSDTSKIELDAIKNGPYDVISKYLKLGFKPLGGGNFIELMRISRAQVINTLGKLNTLLTTIPTQKNENLDLYQILKI